MSRILSCLSVQSYTILVQRAQPPAAFGRISAVDARKDSRPTGTASGCLRSLVHTAFFYTESVFFSPDVPSAAAKKPVGAGRGRENLVFHSVTHIFPQSVL